MTVTAMLSCAPVGDADIDPEISKAIAALDDFDVRYETHAMATNIESESLDEVFAAAQAAHEAIDGDRVVTRLKIDDNDREGYDLGEKVDAVEEYLGREARSDR